MREAIYILIFVDLIVALGSYLLGGVSMLLNSQIGFITSSLVMLGSMKSYQSMVKSRIDLDMVPEDNRDTLSKIEDPYELFDDEEEIDEQKTLKEVVQEERAKLKKSRRSFWQTTKDAKASFSFYRLGAYLFLIIGFFYLNSNGLLDISIYLLSLSFPTVVIVVVLMRRK